MHTRTHRPRRPRVPYLKEKGREPRGVEERDDRCGGERVAPPLAGEDHGRNREPDTEEERPVVRVEEQVERDHEHRQPAPPALDHPADECTGCDQREERGKRVHPGFLAVVGEVRVDGRERGADPAGCSPEERARDPVRKRDAAERRDQREHVCRTLTVAEPADPHVKQEVVERWRAVLAEQVRNRRERVVRDPDGDPLVDPEAGAENARAQPERDGTEHPEAGRRRPARERVGVEARPRALNRLSGGHSPASCGVRLATIRLPS